MPYCQNCGAEVAGNFCPNCGTQAGTVTPATPHYVIHENVVVKPRYSFGSLLLAGWLGMASLLLTLMCLLFAVFASDLSFGDRVQFVFTSLIGVPIALLAYLPGIISIRKTAPEGEFLSTLKSFIVKSLLVIFAWGVTLAGCVYIFGIFFKVWRFGLWASRPNDDQYTAFVDGKKISVTRYYDDLPDYGARGNWVYRDANGEFYRPPVK